MKQKSSQPQSSYSPLLLISHDITALYRTLHLDIFVLSFIDLWKTTLSPSLKSCQSETERNLHLREASAKNCRNVGGLKCTRGRRLTGSTYLLVKLFPRASKAKSKANRRRGKKRNTKGRMRAQFCCKREEECSFLSWLLGVCARSCCLGRLLCYESGSCSH